jgi:hypothetical protein
MKRSVSIMLVVLMGLIVAQPVIGRPLTGGAHFSGGYRYPGGGYRYPGGGYRHPGGGYYPRGGHGYYGGGYRTYRGYGYWYGPPSYVGPWFFPYWYVTIVPPIYATPPPVALPALQPPYAYPDPAFVEKYGGTNSAQDSGEWVTVPGQYVDGTWVKEHKVWVPRSR